ncbi:hypothetical protein FNH04_00580 [Streptomyces phyllanthi]|uniref:Uncharacterized protein n=2 Tax=Streptomyces phyllanthi TaxID=1803180 RepID=A0A5N8VTE1_9ACTN|nr:hypothetical protein [Streptomyces phyllanthi]MPY38511.1 hypothetical protein [Streptomyces phyllanthi]
MSAVNRHSGGGEAEKEQSAAEAAESMWVPESLRVPSPDEIVGQAFPHRDPLVITGITVICQDCGAREDWLILLSQRVVHVRCRCGHEWREPELTPAWFEETKRGPAVEYHSSAESVVQSLGFDGTFKGIYL